ncbi:MAG: PA2779 family protein [Thermoanaerobaculia bacterium]
MRNRRAVLVVFGLTILLALPAVAGPAPSKTAPEQSLEAREADLETVTAVLEIDGVVNALEAQGFSKSEVEERIAALSNEDLGALAQNIEQLEAAGLTNDQWLWMGLGALVVLLIVLL